MGQYYKPSNLDKKEALHSHDYANGLKLMEHSYVRNDFVNAVVMLLAGDWKGNRLVWAGDYADPEFTNEEGDDINIYTLEFRDLKKLPTEDYDYKYILNHSKREFVIIDNQLTPDWNIHPLPLLTCEGNGKGGGDYIGQDPEGLIGQWSRDSLESIKDKKDIPESYTELIFNLAE